MFFVLIFSLFLTVVVQSETLPPIRPLVNTKQGWVQGVVADDGDYYAFYGIPYGGDTSGRNRFKAPTPPPTFTDIFEATIRDIVCAQFNHLGEISGVEDCLRLSIFTKTATSQFSRPVLVWLIGDDFTTSDPLQHSFRRLVEEDFVIVAVNYRLSILGFLCLGTEDAPGNAGIKDVMQALEWIQQNIVEFGGDPNNVVLVGHGSGAAIADFITMSSSSQGLVHKVIAMSGSALASWAVTRDPVARAFEFGRRLVWNIGNDKDQLTDILLKTEVNELLTRVDLFQFFHLQYPYTVAFAPCLENSKLNDSSIFLTDTPMAILTEGSYNHVPYLYSYLNREGTKKLRYSLSWLQQMNANFSNFIPVDLNLDIAQHDQIRNFYFGTKSIDWNAIEQYLDYVGDIWIVQPMILGARNRAQTSNANLYLMEFQYKGTASIWPDSRVPISGAAYGQLLNYILDFNVTPNESRGVGKRIIDSFVAFINNGNPATNQSVTWDPLSNQGYNFIHYFGSDSETLFSFGSGRGYLPPQGRSIGSLWNTLYENNYSDISPSFSSSAANKFSVYLLVMSTLLPIVSYVTQRNNY